MTRVGFITTPLTSGDAVRGVGFYTKNLLAHLKSQAHKFNLEITELTDLSTLNDVHVDLLHYPYFHPFFPTLPIFKPCKTIVTIHDLIPLEFPQAYPPGVRGWLNLQRQKIALSSIAAVITDSQASVQSIHNYLGVPSSKLKLIYLAASRHFQPITDKKKLITIQKKYGLPSKFVLYVGDVNYNKNIPGLVTACQIAGLPLVIVGKQAANLDYLDLSHPELAHLKAISLSRILRLGFVSDADLVAIYNLAHVYCQPSFAEGFGLPVLEALACGTPVACANTHSLPEIAGEAATYFDPCDVNDIARALTQATSKNGPAQASKFTWAKTATETLMVYQQ